MVLCYSRYLYAQIVLDQSVKTFIQCHVNAMRYFGGVPQVVKIDNLKAGVIDANFYEPLIQRTYASFASHYGFLPQPCRIYTPTDYTEDFVIVPLGHSQSTVYQYGLAWNELIRYLNPMVKNSLWSSWQSICEASARTVEKGTLKIWRFKLYRLAVAILIEVYHTGRYEWKFHHVDPNDYLHAEHKRIHEAFQRYLAKAGKSNGTRNLYGTVSRQFLSCLQNEFHVLVLNLQLDDVRALIVSISQLYQKTSMRTVLSALRVFLSFLWMTGETAINLTAAVPSSGSRKVAVVPTLTAEEEVHLLQSIDRSTCLGRRNYAMMLLVIRTGLRTVDIINLKLTDINWRSNTINIIQQKNRRPLSLPLLPDVDNALIDYILHARPESVSPYIFLKIYPPFVKLTDCCVDGLTGFREAISAVYPKAGIQRCIIHQLRASTRYVSYKHIKAFVADLKNVYTALTEEQAFEQLAAFKDKWSIKYPSAIKSWEDNWDILSTFFAYPPQIRKIIYTTNIIEGLHRQFRKVTKTKSWIVNSKLGECCIKPVFFKLTA